MIDPVQHKEVNDLIDADIEYAKENHENYGKCGMCPKLAIEEFEFETGNGANYQTTIPLCEDHAKELEDTGYDFEEKYAEQIYEGFCEDLRGRADMLHDQMKDIGF